jgi:phosphoenolpyruvate carboxykinase (ATP)
MLGERIARHDVQCWLVNTGWTGGPYGVGHRVDLKSTRAMVRAALAGALGKAATRREPVFGLEVPKHVPGVPDALLDPRTTWKDPAAYDDQAKKLTALFRKNFEQFAELVPVSVREAGPKT